MRSKRVKFLLTSCWASSVISFVILAAMILQAITSGRGFKLVTFYTILYFGSFFLHGLLVMQLVKKHYPDSEISSRAIFIHRMFAIVIILQFLIIVLALIGMLLSDDSLGNFLVEIRDPVSFVTYLLLLLLFICQMHILIVGSNVLRRIQRNYRSQLMDSI